MNNTNLIAVKARAQALIEAELAQTPRPAEDDPRLPANVEVFPVCIEEDETDA